jgi:hypothetical protein
MVIIFFCPLKTISKCQIVIHWLFLRVFFPTKNLGGFSHTFTFSYIFFLAKVLVIHRLFLHFFPYQIVNHPPTFLTFSSNTPKSPAIPGQGKNAPTLVPSPSWVRPSLERLWLTGTSLGSMYHDKKSQSPFK